MSIKLDGSAPDYLKKIYAWPGGLGLKRLNRYVVAALEDGLHNAIFFLSFALIGTSIIMGGGTHSGFFADVLLQLMSLPLLWVATAKLTEATAIRSAKLPLLFITAVAAIPLMQLIPLPASIWARLSGRDVIANTYVLLGESLPWRPLTLSPAATWLSALAILPPATIFFATLTLSYWQRRTLSVALVAIGVMSAFLGLLQLVDGANSALRFYSVTNTSEAVGFFANRNHFAALLYVAMVFAICWMVELATKFRWQPRSRFFDTHDIFFFAAFGVAFVVLFAGQMMARSRAGLLLAIAALLSRFFFFLVPDRRARSVGFLSNKFVIGIIIAAVVFSLPATLSRILDRFGLDAVSDARFTIVRNTICAAFSYMPFGSGLGTFVPVYQMFEKPNDIGVAYINHAHNDALEIWLEAGVPGLVLMAIYVCWLARRMARVWRDAGDEHMRSIDRGLAGAAVIVLVLLLVHSLVDYPLRTYALSAIAAFCTGLLFPPVGIALEMDSVGPAVRPPQRSHEKPGRTKRDRADDAQRDRHRPVRPRELLGQSVNWPVA